MTSKAKVKLGALIAILFVALSPSIPVLLAAAVARANNCVLSESGPSPCIILGHDFGGLLNGLGVLGWLGLATIPLAGLLFLAWLIWVLVSLKSRDAVSKSSPTG